jgi:aminoglycoside phosphotransferase
MSSVPKDQQSGTGEGESVSLDLVFTHGDWCVPNVLLDGGSAGGGLYRVAGVVDW